MSVDRFERETGSFEWSIKKVEGGVWLTFKAKTAPIEPAYEKFIQAASILTGRQLRPVSLSILEGGVETSRLVNRLHEQESEKLLTPIPMERDSADDAHFFLERFMESAQMGEPPSETYTTLIHRYWHRILRARENDIENSSLVLSVAIEGLIKETLISERNEDPDFVEQVEHAKLILKKAGLKPRALECIRSSLGNALRPRVQDVLHRLVDKGILRKGNFDAWKALRNAAAHGAVLEDDEKAFQEHIDRFQRVGRESCEILEKIA